jgi:hypothetical protein
MAVVPLSNFSQSLYTLTAVGYTINNLSCKGHNVMVKDTFYLCLMFRRNIISYVQFYPFSSLPYHLITRNVEELICLYISSLTCVSTTDKSGNVE